MVSYCVASGRRPSCGGVGTRVGFAYFVIILYLVVLGFIGVNLEIQTM